MLLLKSLDFYHLDNTACSRLREKLVLVRLIEKGNKKLLEWNEYFGSKVTIPRRSESIGKHRQSQR
jgi:hypothetical protein